MTRFVLAAALALASVVAGCGKDPEPAREVRPVQTTVARMETIPELPAQTGEIRPHFETDLGFKIAGKVAWRCPRLGAHIAAGEVVGRLDDRDQRNQGIAARADLASARASLAQAAAEERRQATLRAEGWSTQARYDAALQARDTAAAAVRAAEAKLQLARDQLGYAVLRAPEDGAVTALGAEAGQVVAAGQMVVRLARLDQKDAVFSLAESAMPALPSQSAVEVRLLDDPAVAASGTVTEISPSADPVTRTYTVKVALPDAPAALRLGMTVVGRFPSAGRPAIRLPGSALFQKDGQPAVWVVDPASATVSLATVEIRRVDPDQVLIGGGLAEGAVVVTAGTQTLVPGQKVRLMDGGGAAP